MIAHLYISVGVTPECMTPIRTIAVAVVLVVSAAGAPLAGATPAVNGTEESNDVAPGERLSGVVDVQGAELEGDLDGRAFGIRVAEAATEGAKADVVAEQVRDVEERLDELEERKAELEEKRAAGEISRGEYEAEVATIAVEARTAERLADASAEEASELPAEALEERGVDVESIQTLKAEASDLTGQEVAAIARSIAGNDVGAPVGGPEHADQRQPGSDAPDDDRDATIERAIAAIERAEERIAQAERRVDAENGDATDALEEARNDLEAARTALDDAKDAREAGDDEAVAEHAEEAIAEAEDALDSADEALDDAEERDRDRGDRPNDRGGD